MSGGVDSSVAAALLKESGYDVIGVTMNLFALPAESCRSEALSSCCGWRGAEDAQAVAMALRIPHYVADFRADFEKSVIADFCREYGLGRTPNPCIRCNRFIKFGLLLKKAAELGAEYIATGHHARIQLSRDSSAHLLKKGVDPRKDQSYFLYFLNQAQLGRVLMPVGDYSKKEIRKKAESLALPTAAKRESQEVCFIPGRDYPGFLKGRLPDAFRPGPILDTSGRAVGSHQGIARYTVGQRKGMGIAAAHPLYVTAVDPLANTITVGRNEDLFREELAVSEVSFISGRWPAGSFEARVKIRYRHEEAEAVLIPLERGRVRVEFKKAQRAITPGQSAVFYDGEIVIGGGIIESSGPRA